MSTFNHLIKNLYINETKLDVVIISDHFDLSKISENNKKYIPILFDYDNIKIGDTIETTGIKLCIKDKVIDKYNTTNMNPFPKNVNVTVKFDLVGTYSDLLKKFDSMSDKDIQRVVDILEKKSDIIQKIIVNKLDK